MNVVYETRCNNFSLRKFLSNFSPTPWKIRIHDIEMSRSVKSRVKCKAKLYSLPKSLLKGELLEATIIFKGPVAHKCLRHRCDLDEILLLSLSGSSFSNIYPFHLTASEPLKSSACVTFIFVPRVFYRPIQLEAIQGKFPGSYSSDTCIAITLKSSENAYQPFLSQSLSTHYQFF